MICLYLQHLSRCGVLRIYKTIEANVHCPMYLFWYQTRCANVSWQQKRKKSCSITSTGNRVNVAHNSGASLYFVLSKTIASKAEPNNFLKQHSYIALSMLCLIALCVIFWVNHFIAATGRRLVGVNGNACQWIRCSVSLKNGTSPE